MSSLGARRTSALVACPVLVATLLIAAPAAAQRDRDRDQDQDRGRRQSALADPARLDDAIRDAHAAADAAREGGNRSLAERMNAFARKAASVRERIGDRRGDADRARRDLVRLADDSHALQRDLAGGRAAPPEAAAAWARVVRACDQMTGAEASGTSGSRRDDERATDRERERDRAEAPRGDEEARDRGALPTELDRRVRRAQSLADQAGVGEANSLIDRFAERSARLTAEFGTLSVEERQDRAKRLLDEARQVQQSLTRQNASPDLVDEWNQVIDVLTRMGGAR